VAAGIGEGAGVMSKKSTAWLLTHYTGFSINLDGIFSSGKLGKVAAETLFRKQFPDEEFQWEQHGGGEWELYMVVPEDWEPMNEYKLSRFTVDEIVKHAS